MNAALAAILIARLPATMGDRGKVDRVPYRPFLVDVLGRVQQ
jgi:hypothetical protein